MAIENKIVAEPAGKTAPHSFSQAPSPEEIARRMRVVDEMLKLRAEVGSVPVTTAELLSHRYEEEDE